MKIKNEFVFKIQLQHITLMHFAHSSWGPGEDTVSFFEGDIVGDVRNESVERKDQVAAVSLLYPLAIAFHSKCDVRRVFQRVDFLERSERGRAVKGLGNLPRMALLDASSLKVPGREVDPNRDGIVVTTGV